jgi:hypothetical protein
MTMQMQATRDWLASGTIRVEPERMLHCWWVVHYRFWMRERRRSNDVVGSLNGSESEYSQSFRHVLNINCCSI